MTAAVGAWRRASLEVRAGVVAALVAVIVAILLLDPLGPATVDPDATASVLYFERIVAGTRLEGFVPTTPKPLLTLGYGFAWTAFGDWRVLVWATIGAFGVASGALATLVGRLARRAVPPSTPASDLAVVAAAAFVTAALVTSSDVLLEVSRANSLIWALAFWAIAGLAVSGPAVRPRVAGVALLLAGLCRFETLAIAAVAVVATAAWWWSGRPAGPMLPGIAERGEAFTARAAVHARSLGRRAAIGAGLAVAWLPLVMAHDWLLTGDPGYWLSVPARYTAIYNAGLTSIDPAAYGGTVLAHLAAEWPIVVLAAFGFAGLARSRQWLPLSGIASIAAGVTGLLFWLAWRATYISNRYWEPLDASLLVVAAIGMGWVVATVAVTLAGTAAGVARRRSAARVPARAGTVAAVGAAAVLGVAVTWPALPWDRRATAEMASVRQASADVELVRDDLGRILSDVGTDGRLRSSELVVPSRDVSRLAIELDVPVTLVRDSYAMLLNGGADALQTRQVVFHDAAADRPVALYRQFEIDDQGPLGGHILVRLDPRLPGIWILSVR